MKQGSLCTCVMIILLLLGTAHATVWYVHPDSTMNCIQDGLDSCSTEDTVCVGPGVYYENILWPGTDGIDLISEYGPDSTIIDGDSADRVIDVTTSIDTLTIIQGFTIRNGYANNSFGGGIYCDGTSPKILNNIFTGNVAYGGYYSGGGAIACLYNSSPVIESNTMENNIGTWGGAILCNTQCAPAILNNVIYNNSADSVGGGILCYMDCSPVIAGNTITENSAHWGGGIGIWNFSSPIVSDNVITDNTAGFMGGGIYCYGNVSPTLEYNEITNNICTYSGGTYGGGIRCSPNTSGVMRHCDISDNTGVGISIRLSSLDIDSCAIQSNTSHGIRSYDGSNPTINWCNIVDNAGYGLMNEDPGITINAENNWWGDTSGPGGFGPGSGDQVSNYVDYEPWLEDSVENIGIEEGEEFEVSNTGINLLVYPNPFRYNTNIRFGIKNQYISGLGYQKPEIKIYDAIGRLMKQWDYETIRLSNHITWDGTDNAGKRSPCGVYFVELTVGNYTATEKLLLIR